MAESGTTQHCSVEELGSEGIWEMKQMITKLETNSIIGNPGFPSINQIFCSIWTTNPKWHSGKYANPGRNN